MAEDTEAPKATEVRADEVNPGDHGARVVTASSLTDHMVTDCPECGDDAELVFPSAEPGAPDFYEYQCGACDHQFRRTPAERPPNLRWLADAYGIREEFDEEIAKIRVDGGWVWIRGDNEWTPVATVEQWSAADEVEHLRQANSLLIAALDAAASETDLSVSEFLTDAASSRKNPPPVPVAVTQITATLTCSVCGDVLPVDDWAWHVHSVPGDEECGWTWSSEDVICTMPTGHDGPHGSWAFREDRS